MQIEKIIEYTDENIICRFTDMFDIDEAEDILKETFKFLYISNLSGVFIPDDLLVLDEISEEGMCL